MNTKKILLFLCGMVSISLFGCNQNQIIEVGDVVHMDYQYTFFDGSTQQDSILFTVGENSNQWLSDVLYGKKIGDVCTGSIPGKTVFQYDNDKVQSFADIILMEVFGLGNPQIGDQISLNSLGDGIIIGTQTNDNGQIVYQVDFNNPKAYLDLDYSIQITDIDKK